MDFWSKAWEIVGVSGALASKHPDKISELDIHGLINAIKLRNKFKFYEHLYWILRSIGEHKLAYEEDSEKLFKLVNELVDSDLSKEELAVVTPHA